MTETISRPSNFSLNPELSMQKYRSDCVLVQNIIHVANSLVIFDPSAIRYLQLTILYKFFDLFLFIRTKIFVPIFEKEYFSHKIFSALVFSQGLIHRVENSFGVTLVHGVKKSSWSKIDVFEFVVGVEPKGIEVRMEAYKELLI